MIRTHERTILTLDDGSELLIEVDNSREGHLDVTLRINDDDESTLTWDAQTDEGLRMVERLRETLERISAMAQDQRIKAKRSFPAPRGGIARDEDKWPTGATKV